MSCLENIFQHLTGKIQTYKNIKGDDNTVLTLINAANDTLIYSNSSIDLNEYNNRTNGQQFSDDEELDNWPPWVQKVTNVSHLLLALNSSVNFYIYFMKRQALNSGNPGFCLEPTYLLHQGILGHKNVYIFFILILQIKICLPWIDEKPFDYLLFNEKNEK